MQFVCVHCTVTCNTEIALKTMVGASVNKAKEITVLTFNVRFNYTDRVCYHSYQRNVILTAQYSGRLLFSCTNTEH